MNLTAHSRNRLLNTFAQWDVPRDFVDPMYHYLVWGFRPGSCFEAVLANDFLRAVSASHPSNTINSFKALAGWINDHCPKVARGSYKQILFWSSIDEGQRRSILEAQGLIFTSKEEVVLILKEQPTVEPQLY